MEGVAAAKDYLFRRASTLPKAYNGTARETDYVSISELLFLESSCRLKREGA
jgi:hypothetical protein